LLGQHFVPVYFVIVIVRLAVGAVQLIALKDPFPERPLTF